MQKSATIRKVAFIGDYLPRKCGIATFTTDLRTSIAREFPQIECLVVPINDIPEGYDYPNEVRFEIIEKDLMSYIRAAEFLNITNVDLVCVQHEFGIYGGEAGRHLISLLHELEMPIVTTLHTLLQKPSESQLVVMKELILLSTRLVVMTEKGIEILQEVYNVPREKIDLIPHGIPDMPFSDPNYYKSDFGVAGKNVLLTFGLLSPNKGIEYILNALPGILREFPNTVFIVVGQTHPNLILQEGELYRLGLERLCHDLEIEKNVVFVNHFMELTELMRFIGATDIYLTPYLSENQITSGTLAYAYGAGNAVISTPYWHAAELLRDGKGRIVPFRDSPSIEKAVVELLGNDPLRHSMRKKAYETGRNMVWSATARKYLKAFHHAGQEHNFIGRKLSPIKTVAKHPGELPVLNLNHLFYISDSTGIFQHAKYTIPNYHEGYCTDDNARALLLTLMLEPGNYSVRTKELTGTYLSFLYYAFNPEKNRFRNFMRYDRSWIEEFGSEDCTGNALWALGFCVRRTKQKGLQMLAAELFDQVLPSIVSFSSPRSWAIALIGINEYLQRFAGDRRTAQIRELLTSRLLQRYKDASVDDWHWFEDIVSYANAKLSHALIQSGRQMNDQNMIDVGLESLQWLTRIQTSDSGSFRPIGSNGFYTRGEERPNFDQQPIEAHATVSACIEAFHASGDNAWAGEARRAFEWFLGRNDLALSLYNPSTGGCRDGLHVDRASQNEGAESTLAFLLSLIEMQNFQSDQLRLL